MAAVITTGAVGAAARHTRTNPPKHSPPPLSPFGGRSGGAPSTGMIGSRSHVPNVQTRPFGHSCSWPHGLPGAGSGRKHPAASPSTISHRTRSSISHVEVATLGSCEHGYGSAHSCAQHDLVDHVVG